MKNVVLLSVILFLSGCTYSINVAQTVGKAKDLIDETSTNTPTVSPNIEVPLTKIP